MTITIDADKSCWYESPEGSEHSPAERVEVITDHASRMCMALMNGLRIAITSDEAEALVAEGAKDSRELLRAGGSESII